MPDYRPPSVRRMRSLVDAKCRGPMCDTAQIKANVICNRLNESNRLKSLEYRWRVDIDASTVDASSQRESNSRSDLRRPIHYLRELCVTTVFTTTAGVSIYCEEHEYEFRNYSADHFDFDPNRCDPNLAPQPRLGLWSKWGCRTCADRPNCFIAYGKNMRVCPGVA